MAGNMRHVVNMANSIVGVSILSMPFCFKETGLVLGILLVLLSGVITKKTCMFLIRSAIMARRRSYEFLAFHVFGVSGKLFVELCMILFLIGICISFHVVMGDLAPAIAARIMNVENSPSLRCTLLIGIALLVVLPLCLLRNLDSLASMSACSIGFYFFLILFISWHAFPRIMDGSWYQIAELVRPSAALQVLPIYVLGLSCQSNVFEIYDSIPDPDVPKMRSVVNHAVNLCCALYIAVGFLGYVAFVDQDLAGNLILNFPNSQLTEGIKVFFTVSLAISFPLMIFPCRTSIHSLLYRRSNPSSFDLVGNYMPESRFKAITLGILTTSLVVGILIPNIEFVLGVLGSTMGMVIALILPSLFFIKVNSKASAERLLAQGIMLVGIVLIVTGTYLNVAHIRQVQVDQQVDTIGDLAKNGAVPNLPNIEKKGEEGKAAEVIPAGGDSATRREPVAPEPPPEETEKKNEEKSIINRNLKEQEKSNLKEPEGEKRNLPSLDNEEIRKKADDLRKSVDVKDEKNEGDTLHPDAIKKEEKVNKEEGNTNKKEEVDKKQAELLEKIEVHNKEQQQQLLAVLEESKQILQELKEAKQEQDLKRQEEESRAAVNVPVPNAAVVEKPGAVVPVVGNPGAAPINSVPANPAVGMPAGAAVPGAVSNVQNAAIGPVALQGTGQGQVKNLIAPQPQGNLVQGPDMVVPQQIYNYKVDQVQGNQGVLPNYPSGGNQVGSPVVSGDSQPGYLLNQVQPVVQSGNDIGKAPNVAGGGGGILNEGRSPSIHAVLPGDQSQNQVPVAQLQDKVEVPLNQPQERVPEPKKAASPVLQSQGKVKDHIEEPLKNIADPKYQKDSPSSKGGDTLKAKDSKKSAAVSDVRNQVNVGQIGAPVDSSPKTKESKDLPSNNKQQSNPPSSRKLTKSIKESKKKTEHDEERRKRDVDNNYLISLPEVNLLKEIKPRDAGDVAYDTRHLLWNSRSRRKRRRNDRGRDDYYWDET